MLLALSNILDSTTVVSAVVCAGKTKAKMLMVLMDSISQIIVYSFMHKGDTSLPFLPLKHHH